MPEYLAPGVYVEETALRAETIQGVVTHTTAFAGPTRKGPVASATQLPELLTGFADFERLYGGLEELHMAAAEPAARTLNFMAHAARAYFNEGGTRLYVTRVMRARSATDLGLAQSADLRRPPASGTLPAESQDNRIRFAARMPGRAGNGVLPGVQQPLLRDIQTREVVSPAPLRVMDTAPEGSLLRRGASAATATYFLKMDGSWRAIDAASTAPATTASDLSDAADAALITLAVLTTDGDGAAVSHDDMGYERGHPRWVGRVMGASPEPRVDPMQNLYTLQLGARVSAKQLLDALFPQPAVAPSAAEASARFEHGRRGSIMLSGGNDGAEPDAASYTGAFDALAALDDIRIVAAPGSSTFAEATAIRRMLIGHAEGPHRYRIAVLDTAAGLNPEAARAERAHIDSPHAAMYYPWVIVSNPNARPGRADIAREIALPPSGFLCGIYARSDIERGVFKAPANEVLRGALRFEREITQAEQEVLNPLGINCLRFFPGRGFRVWGARTASSDPAYKYVNLRRYLDYLAASIGRGTRWAVFEPNDERLWAQVRTTIADFLQHEWTRGALLGSKPELAFFVRCERSTMTQDDLDKGRLVCLVGVAAQKPAEFMLLRIGQKTASVRA